MMISKFEFIKAFRMGYASCFAEYNPEHLEKLDLKKVDGKAEESFNVRVLQIYESQKSMDEIIEEFYGE